jgi:hypothetical protein
MTRFSSLSRAKQRRWSGDADVISLFRAAEAEALVAANSLWRTPKLFYLIIFLTAYRAYGPLPPGPVSTSVGGGGQKISAAINTSRTTRTQVNGSPLIESEVSSALGSRHPGATV